MAQTGKGDMMASTVKTAAVNGDGVALRPILFEIRTADAASAFGGDDFAHMELRPIYEKRDGSGFCCASSPERDDDANYSEYFRRTPLGGLVIACQLSKPKDEESRPAGAYGFCVEYRDVRVTPENVGLMADVFKRIDKGLAKYVKEWGPVGNSFGRYVLYTLRALGVERVRWYGGKWSGWTVRAVDGDLASDIDSRISHKLYDWDSAGAWKINPHHV